MTAGADKPSQGRQARSTVVAVLIIVTATGVLGYNLVGGPDPLEGVPDAPELRSSWACQNCGQVVHLSPRQRMVLQRRTQQAVPDPTAPDRKASDDTAGATSLRELVLACPVCGQKALRKAPACPKCRTVFAPKLKGVLQRCPQCGWNWKSTRKRRSTPHPPPRPRRSP